MRLPKTMVTLSFVASSLISSCASFQEAQSESAETSESDNQYSGIAFIQGRGGASAAGKFSLVKVRGEVCAVKFFDIKYVGTPTSGNYTARYKYYMLDREGAPISSGSGQLHSGGHVYNFLGFGFSNDEISFACGTIKLVWLGPTTVYIASAGTLDARMNEFNQPYIDEYFFTPTNCPLINSIHTEYAKTKWQPIRPWQQDYKINKSALLCM